MRGNGITSQPFSMNDQHGNDSNVLLWNGEVFGGKILNMMIEHDKDNTMCDTAAVWIACQEYSNDIPCIFLNDMIEGPYAFIYYQVTRNKLWFGRDCFGRRSLLWNGLTDSCNGQISYPAIITSSYLNISTIVQHFEEVPVDGIYCLENINELHSNIIMKKYPRNCPFSLTKTIPSTSYIELLYGILYESVKKRVTMVDRRDIRIGILFSGGLDSAVIAAIADKILPLDHPIDLINVAFENPRFLKYQKQNDPFSIVPDRQTALLCIEKDLVLDRRKRNWNFIPVNVSVQEMEQWKAHICSLVGGSITTMDWSIAAPFWFASKGTPEMTKILLCGFGADELLGGYRRYRTRYEHCGWDALEQEMQLDLKRMWKRNLGRDDRVLSDHGKEVRYPFLDEGVVKTILESIPIKARVDFENIVNGQSEKHLLREMAREKLGLHYSSTLPKRAIQFGCKSAKLYSSDERGTDAFE